MGAVNMTVGFGLAEPLTELNAYKRSYTMLLRSNGPRRCRLEIERGRAPLFRSLGGIARSAAFLVAAAFFVTAPALVAQQSGHYLQGITGLDDGSAPPPGVYVTYLPYLNLVNSFKGPNGDTIQNVDLNIVIHNAVVQVMLPKKFLGATYGFNLTVPIANTRLEGNGFGPFLQSAGLSDIYVAPVVLGWDKGRSTYLFDAGFYAPTGDFNRSSPLNPGLGFWEEQLQAGATYNFDKNKLWNASLLSTWEFNQGKQRRDLQPGPMATFEYSFGRRFLKGGINVGAAGFAYQKLSADTGGAVPPAVRGNLDRAFGLGPEFKLVNPKYHMALDVRYEPQFGVQSRTSGSIVVISLTYLHFLAPR
jgi:hypothetical protein